MRDDARPIITRSRLVADLRRLGLEAGQMVEMHASVKAIGWVVGGPDLVIQSVLDVLTPAGTLMMYAGWDEAPYDLAGWPEEKRRAYLEECPPFDPKTSRAVRAWSVLAECLRTWPGAHRSDHPEASVAAVGARAECLTADHPLQYGYGPGSPWAKLHEAGGSVLLLGAPLDSLTPLHYAEHVADVPDKRIVRYKMPVLRDGARVWVDIEEYDTSRGIVDWPGGDYFGAIGRAHLASGRGREGKVGEADSYLFDARSLIDFAVAWMEREFARVQ